MIRQKIISLALVAALVALSVAALTSINAVHIFNSAIDATTLGATTPAAATVTTLTATTSASAPTINGTNITASSALNGGAITASGSVTSPAVYPTNVGVNIYGLGTDGGGKIIPRTRYVDVSFVIDGGGAPITTGSKGVLQIPADWTSWTWYGWTVFGDRAGTISITAKQGAFASYPSDTSLGYIIGLSPGQDHNGNWSAGNISGSGNNFVEFVVNSTDGALQRVTVVLRATIP